MVPKTKLSATPVRETRNSRPSLNGCLTSAAAAASARKRRASAAAARATGRGGAVPRKCGSAPKCGPEMYFGIRASKYISDPHFGADPHFRRGYTSDTGSEGDVVVEVFGLLFRAA